MAVRQDRRYGRHLLPNRMKGPPLQKQPLLQVQPASPPMWTNGRSDNSVVLGAVGGVFIGLIALTLISRWMIRICRPNEMLVVTGSRSDHGSQGMKGYRVVANGGWTFVKPILETARRVDVTLLPVVVEVRNLIIMMKCGGPQVV